MKDSKPLDPPPCLDLQLVLVVCRDVGSSGGSIDVDGSGIVMSAPEVG